MQNAANEKDFFINHLHSVKMKEDKQKSHE